MEIIDQKQEASTPPLKKVKTSFSAKQGIAYESEGLSFEENEKLIKQQFSSRRIATYWLALFLITIILCLTGGLVGNKLKDWLFPP